MIRSLINMFLCELWKKMKGKGGELYLEMKENFQKDFK